MLAGFCNLSLLISAVRVLLFVVSGQEENDLSPVEVDEHSKQNGSVALGELADVLASKHVLNLSLVMADTELEETFSKRSEPAR